MASFLPCLGNADNLRRQTDLARKSEANLKVISMAVWAYADSRKDYLPGSFDDLLYGGFFSVDDLSKTFIAPYDKISKVDKSNRITRQSSTYVYVGKGLHLGRNSHELFIAFEDPAKLPSTQDSIAVLYLNDTVKRHKLPESARKNCRAAAEYLLQSIKAPAADKALILRNAAEAEKAANH